MASAPVVAYLISSDTSPDRPTRLAEVLRAGSPRGVIAIRHDDSAGPLDLRRMHALDVDLLENSRPEPGSAAELMMLLRCLRRVLESAQFDWLVMLSGSDYPVRPVAEIEAALAGADGDAFVATHACQPPAIRRGTPVEEHAARYHYRWSSAPRPIAPVAHALAAALGPRVLVRRTPGGIRIGVPAKRSPFKAPQRKPLAMPTRQNPLSALYSKPNPFGAGLDCRYGARSFTLSRRAIEVLDAAVREHPELVLYYRDTLVPAESYIHTVLANDRTISLRDEPRHRELSGVVDVDTLLAAGADFAGPFDPDTGLLEAIDARVHRV